MIATTAILATRGIGLLLGWPIPSIPTAGAGPLNAFPCRYTMPTRAVDLVCGDTGYPQSVLIANRLRPQCNPNATSKPPWGEGRMQNDECRKPPKGRCMRGAWEVQAK